MLLLYDHKCNLCQNLAYKIHINTRKKVTIQSLSDPETSEILRAFYPNGWSHDFLCHS
jgi:predicted DCC family thiol-disulfide oxidoreductase YuxK